jgi:hypothetical protein
VFDISAPIAHFGLPSRVPSQVGRSGPPDLYIAPGREAEAHRRVS